MLAPDRSADLDDRPATRARPTILDVAREAGVSTATVDRVLHGRTGVKARTRSRVLGAAERLGYVDPGLPDAPAAARLALDVILPGGTNTFMNILADRITEMGTLRAAEADVRVHRIEGFVPEVLAQALLSMRGASDGVAIIALDHPIVREAIRDLAAHHVPVLTLVSDISNVPRSAYVGIDNRAAGRLAGHLLGRFIGPSGGQVELFAGSLSYRGHEEREMGFRHMLAEDFSSLSIVQTIEVRDDSERSYGEAKALLARVPGLAGIYNIGAGNRGIARALQEAGKTHRIVFIGHELTPHTRQFLLSGVMDAVIDQNPRVEARELIDRLMRAARGEASPRGPALRVQAIFRENIPEV
jgi:LacI family transcriptional regulator